MQAHLRVRPYLESLELVHVLARQPTASQGGDCHDPHVALLRSARLEEALHRPPPEPIATRHPWTARGTEGFVG